jgi:hypothetical protein
VAERPDAKTPALVVVDRVVTLTLAGGVFLVLVAGIVTPVSGGRHSTKLKWEQRKQTARVAVPATPSGPREP